MAEKLHTINGIGHFDIAGPDIESLQRFYSDVVGWETEPQGPGYALVRTPAGSPDGAFAETPVPSITIGVIVSDVDVAVNAARRAGGEIVMPTTDNGWVVKAQIADPAGNRITLIQG